jgi:biopolymer transport protein TolR
VARRALGRKVNSDINVTPMADIMLVLLIIFMITTPLLQSGITVNLPKAINPHDAKGAGKKGAVIVALNRDGKIFIAQRQIGENDLYEYLKTKFPAGELNRSIYLKADTALEYRRVVQIINGCREAGIDKIGLMAEKDKEKK